MDLNKGFVYSRKNVFRDPGGAVLVMASPVRQ